MALHYSLAKVYALSENDPEFVSEIMNLFVSEVVSDLEKLKVSIEEKAHKTSHVFAHKIKPSLDLLGMNVAFEEMQQIEVWANSEGKKKEINKVMTFLTLSVSGSRLTIPGSS